jgi:hypothetical protein
LSRGIHVSVGIDRPVSSQVLSSLPYGDQPVPRLGGGGLVRWLETPDQLHRLLRQLGYHGHFLYASAAPSVGQWWLAHSTGGRLVAGAVQVDALKELTANLRAGQVVELQVTSPDQIGPLVQRLATTLGMEHLRAVCVGRLMRDAGVHV